MGRSVKPATAEPAAEVWGREDLTCPLSARFVAETLAHCSAHPWRGDTALTCPRHMVSTTAITEPGRPVRLLLSLDYGYHESGWFANSDYEANWHLSVSHPRPEVPRLFLPKPGVSGFERARVGIDTEVPSDEEVRAWGRVFFREHAHLGWFEPAASVFDPYRLPGVVHLRVFVDRQGHPFLPQGEPYHIRPWADGSSPAKVTEGRLGADVR